MPLLPVMEKKSASPMDEHGLTKSVISATDPILTPQHFPTFVPP
jgi:hypothetical protein